ncbi:MAG: ABC transporter permease [Chloroflexi bacterium]|nr:ABC transporter permease [Chloroflexota bacterium]
MTALPLPWSSAAGRQRWVRRNAWTLGVCVLLAIMLLVEKLVHPSMGSFEIQTLVIGSLPLAFAAMAQAAVVLSGGIDLSVGSLMTLVNVLAALWMASANFGEALLLSLALVAVGALAGAFTGALITVTRVPDIVVTLAMSFVWAGVALQAMPTPGGGAPIDWQNLMTGEVWSYVPEGLFVLALALGVIWLPVVRSRLGLALYAIGSNRNAAYLGGVSVSRTRVAAYALGGVFAALAGLALTAGTATGSANSGASYTLNSVAAVVLGGVTLTGGRGGMLGPVAAAFTLQAVGSVLFFLGYDENYSTVIQGVIVVLVVMFAGLVLARRRR